MPYALDTAPIGSSGMLMVLAATSSGGACTQQQDQPSRTTRAHQAGPNHDAQPMTTNHKPLPGEAALRLAL
jgi:hypothetical protein